MFRVPAHRTGCVPVKPGSDTLFTENVFAVKHYRVMVSVLADRTVTSTGLDLVLARSFTIPRKKLSSSGSGSGTQALRLRLRLSDRDSEPGLTLKSWRPPPTTHPQLLSTVGVSHTKTQRVKLT